MGRYVKRAPTGSDKVAGNGATVAAVQTVRYNAGTPAAASASNAMALTAQPASGTTTVSTGLTQPAVPRSVRCVGNQASCTGNLVVHGTNMAGAVIEDTLAINGTTAVDGTKAFATITSVVIPTRGAAGDQVSLGYGNKLGLPHKLVANTVLAAYLARVKEATAPTVAFDDDELEKNTVLLNSALNGGRVDVVYDLGV